MQGGPLEHIIAAKAVCFGEALKPEFKEYQQQIVRNAKAMADTFTERGIKMVSGGTDNHLILLDLSNTDMTGKELNDMLESVNITVNKNAIPFDPLKPSIASGIRIGTPAITTRGFKEEDAKIVANLIADIIFNRENAFPSVKAEVKRLTEKYPLYEDCFNI